MKVSDLKSILAKLMIPLDDLNGWERTWVVASIFYSVFIIIFLVVDWRAYYVLHKYLMIGFVVWIIPIITLYFLGWSIGWVYRGFKR